MAAKNFRYKEALEEIEQIVHRLENEDPDVDELSVLVKRAMSLIAQCKEKLRSTGDEIQESLREV
jgi:exodeoxyribonuclease VII small subunit